MRERKGDIPLLIDHFLSTLAKGEEEPPHLPVRIREAMETYPWPGNVRELQNVLHTYITLGKLDLMGQISDSSGEEQAVTEPPFSAGAGLRQRMDVLEKKMLLNALEAARWHRGRAAEALQLNYKTLQRKMKAHGIK